MHSRRKTRQAPARRLVGLTEERIAALFAVSRTQVRGVLQRLAVEQLVTLVPDRGAFVATPTAAQAQPNAAGDRPAAVRLSGEFHVLLAALSGSGIYHRMMRELTPLTCLAILSFKAPTAAACLNEEHARLIDAIEAADRRRAAALMVQHLRHIESALDLGREELGTDADLAQLLLG